MKKILVVGLSDNIGGIETFFHTYYTHLDRQKYHFDFISVTDKIAFGDTYISNGAKIFKLPHFLKAPVKYCHAMRRIIHSNNYDIIHINMLSAANILPIIAARREKVPRIIVHSHNSDTPSGAMRKILDKVNRHYLKKGDLTKIACGKKAGNWLFGENSNFQIIYNAIEPKKFKFSKKARMSIRNQLGISNKDILIGNVGRLCEQKNQLFLIELLAKLSDRHKLLIIGSGEYKDKIIAKAKILGVNNRLFMVENTPDVHEYYSAMDIFALPSVFEGMPIAPIEAQANGLPCICSNSVTREADMGNATFLELSIPKWCHAINNIVISSDRKPHLTKSYDITIQASSLEHIYGTRWDKI